MKLMIYGGSFNPPHLGHVNAAQCAVKAARADKLIVIPDYEAPHKDMAENSASPEQRLEMCRLAFDEIENAEISDIEIARGGKSYTSDTLREIKTLYPDAELMLLVGTDMLLSFDKWYEHEWIMQNVTVCVMARNSDDADAIKDKACALREEFGAKVLIVTGDSITVSSTELREALPLRKGRDMVTPREYAYIIKHRLYGANPDFPWLREQAKSMLKPKRVPHVLGCEEEAVRLAEHYGADTEIAAEAGILHDITKKLELEDQLLLCDKYGIILDEQERISVKLLHSKTGAAVAKHEFGSSDAVFDAIFWHTTGKANMTLMEKIIYMADYIEPTRNFGGVDELRRLAYENLDKAMLLGLEMSLEDILSRGERPHENTIAAVDYFRSVV